MKFNRIWAIILRHLLLTTRSADKISNVFYWPLINIVLWGVTGVWLQETSKAPNLALTLLTCLVLWQIVIRVNVETAKGVLEELLSHNLVNIFSTPITFWQWLSALLILGILNMAVVTLSGSFIVYLFYGINIFNIGLIIIPVMLLLLISGWSIGLIICASLINFGLNAQDFLYMLVWAFAPFSAVYYPLSVMPPLVRSIAKALPMSYVFESVRIIISQNIIPTKMLIISLLLNILYFTLSCLLFYFAFKKSLNKGLARL